MLKSDKIFLAAYRDDEIRNLMWNAMKEWPVKLYRVKELYDAKKVGDDCVVVDSVRIQARCGFLAIEVLQKEIKGKWRISKATGPATIMYEESDPSHYYIAREVKPKR